MKYLTPIIFAISCITLTSCTTNGEFDTQKALAVGTSVGMGVLQASMLDENEVKHMASMSAKELDGKSKIASASNAYTKRLNTITQPLQSYDGLQLNFKVYLSSEINAFAMADGTVRVYSGLLDAMPDDQVRAVIGHEVGHVKLRHTYNQMRERVLTDTAFAAAGSVGGYIGTLTSSQLGQLAQTAVNARFSQQDELDADQYAIKLLARIGKDPYAMKRSIETLQDKYGSESSFLSSHPSNEQRIDAIERAIKK